MPEIKKNPKTIAERLNYVMKILNVTQAELAQRIGIKQQTIQSIVSGRIKKSKYLHEIACALAIKPDWLISGIGSIEQKKSVAETQSSKSPKSTLQIPLISWEEALNWHNLKKIYEIKDYQTIAINSDKCSPSSFALKISGSSMEPIFLDGCIVIFDPEKNIAHKSYVLILNQKNKQNNKELIFRQLIIENRNKFLQNLNPSYPNLIIEFPENYIIEGVAIQAIQNF